jgi:hypothetical protein
LDEGEDLDGKTITRMMMNTTIDGITGPVIMNSNGDRLASYSILSMSPDSQIFQPALSYSAEDRELTAISEILWPGDCGNQVYRDMRRKHGGIADTLLTIISIFHLQRFVTKTAD